MYSACRGGRVGPKNGRGKSTAAARAFTVIEVLVVLAIILVLAGLVLAASSYVHNKGARSRAEAEIAAMSAALENYKADNGVYPSDPATTAALDPRTKGNPIDYQGASLTLYKALSGDTDNDSNRQAEKQSYFAFKPNQLSPTDQATAVSFIKDPFGNSYGYSTIFQTDSSKGYNPTFDLWSTSNLMANPPLPPTNDPITPRWIKNW